MTSPFDWNNGKPSIFSGLRAYNGIDTKASMVASEKPKNRITLPGTNKKKTVAQTAKSALQ